MHQQIHQQIAENLLDNYQGQEPLANYLKKYFSANKKHGSRDRKSISAFCYAHFRDGEIDFPLVQNVSSEINVKQFVASHQEQPLLFIRVRPWQREKVIPKLIAAQITYQEITPTTFAFVNTTSLQNVLELNKEVVIQDINSQALASLLALVPTSMDQVLNVWDACAASGGKSILMFDYLSNIKIHVTDIRESILHNCEKRLAEAGIRPSSVQVVDLVYPFEIKKQFDFIFADVPCSGSGTWGRTPEQLKYFKQEQLANYTELQGKIIENLIPALKLHGHLLFATCSVYQNENENNVAKLLATGKFKVVKQQYFKGYDKQADTLFGALLEKIAD
jgi:16S rRNA (cytosine967-C5)-methyltransferase